MQHFTPVSSLVGGVLIGVACAILLLGAERIAGVSGIAGGLFRPAPDERTWRLSFLAGLVLGGVALAVIAPSTVFATPIAGTARLALAGLLVGVGTRVANGCTSGHGVCGLGRLSPRSLVATLTFMTAGFVTTFVVRHVLGAAS